MKRSPLKRSRRAYREPGRLAFRVNVLLNAKCVMDGHSFTRCAGVLDPHHVLPKATLKKRGFQAELWNQDNGIALCRKHHDNHTTAFERVPYELLPAEAIAFAERLGLDYLLDLTYPRRSAEDVQSTRGTDLSAA